MEDLIRHSEIRGVKAPYTTIYLWQLGVAPPEQKTL